MAVLAQPFKKTEINNSMQNTTITSVKSWPNPFHHSTQITYTIPKCLVDEQAKVTVKVFNLANRQIRTLENSHKNSGTYSVFWNGRDDSGNRVPAGIYLYKINGIGYTISKKVVLLK